MEEVVIHMRTFRTSVLAGAGAVALAAGVIAPGVASAGSLDSLGSSEAAPEVVASANFTVEGSDGDAKVTAEATEACTVDFTLDAKQGDASNWVVQYRVDDADPKISSEDGEFYSVFNPVVANHEDDAEALNENYGDEYGWDVGVGEQSVDLSGVEASEDGTHDVKFWIYRGMPKGGWDSDNAQQTGTVEVTGCPTAEEEAFGSLASLDVLGSLGSLLSTEN